ncbi:KGW motif small protein [Acinetobacter sp. TGL-Y2]|nr:KGW motif small protein [Acinetobacter sp. TGL-Y2]
MTRIERYLDRVVLRQKGWILFGMVVSLQLLLILLGYVYLRI